MRAESLSFLCDFTHRRNSYFFKSSQVVDFDVITRRSASQLSIFTHTRGGLLINLLIGFDAADNFCLSRALNNSHFSISHCNQMKSGDIKIVQLIISGSPSPPVDTANGRFEKLIIHLSNITIFQLTMQNIKIINSTSPPALMIIKNSRGHSHFHFEEDERRAGRFGVKFFELEDFLSRLLQQRTMIMFADVEEICC